MRKALLALLAIPVMTLMAGGIEPANAQPEDRRRATTHPAYKSHHRWGYTYMDWCKQEAFPLNEQEGRTMMQINRMLSYLGAIRTRAERAARMTQCEKYDQFVKEELVSLALNGLILKSYHPCSH